MFEAIFLIDIIGALYFIARMIGAKTKTQKVAFPTLVVLSIVSAVLVISILM